MPTYEYECVTHGVFESWRPMSESRLPQACPDCNQQASRVISRAALGVVSSRTRTAHEVNERAAHAPKSAAEIRHKKGCACCTTPARSTAGISERTADGAKSFPDRRPWMISH
jgi:putative FmdB family regulatory protein